ncbi:MAG: hypothetical protein ABIW58_01985 [Sphingomicrobium sp.]
MTRGRLIASTVVAILLVASSEILQAALERTAAVRTEEAACSSVKRIVAAKGHFPISDIAFCDFVVPKYRPKGYFVFALHSTRVCDGICSTNMGWFALQKTTGRVFEWDVAEDRLGRPIQDRP